MTRSRQLPHQGRLGPWHTTGFRLVFAVCLLAVGLGSPESSAAGSAGIGAAERIVAFGDVHGAYEELTALLRATGVVDDQLAWQAGRTHLVSVGDLLDRGGNSRKVLDLLMRLEGEAAAAGGAVHVLVGNHEIMNILGDLRYVAPGEYTAFAADEDPAVRSSQLTAYAELLRNAGRDAASVETEFRERFPPGFFGHRQAFSPSGRYGRWLLDRPVLVVIGDTAFVHGGLAPLVAELGPERINERYRSDVLAYLTSQRELEAAGVLDPFLGFAERERRVRAWIERANESTKGDLVATAQWFLESDASAVLGIDGPLWYRGSALCHPPSEIGIADRGLEALGARRVAIGHTPTPRARMLTRLDGRIVRMDTGMNRAVYGGRPSVLVIEGGEIRARYLDAPGRAAPIEAQAGYVGYEQIGLDEASLLDLLERGAPIERQSVEPGGLELVLEREGRRIHAIFLTGPAGDLRRELAAWRLDRVLGLGLVPPAVRREIGDRSGIVQLRLPQLESQAQLQATDREPGRGWCPLGPQYQLMYAFDALVSNEHRTSDSILYDTTEWMLMLIGHRAAFGPSRRLPHHLESVELDLTPELAARLRRLTRESLGASLGDLLSRREIRALLARRELLLAQDRSTAAPASAEAAADE